MDHQQHVVEQGAGYRATEEVIWVSRHGVEVRSEGFETLR
jgi:hypothetical protein